MQLTNRRKAFTANFVFFAVNGFWIFAHFPMLAWLAATLGPFPEFDPWKAKERWSDLPTFENIVKECMLSYDHFFDFDHSATSRTNLSACPSFRTTDSIGLLARAWPKGRHSVPQHV